jgi:hypothetical protein
MRISSCAGHGINNNLLYWWFNVTKIEIKFGSVTFVTLELFLYLYLCSVNMGRMVSLTRFTKVQY